MKKERETEYTMKKKRLGDRLTFFKSLNRGRVVAGIRHVSDQVKGLDHWGRARREKWMKFTFSCLSLPTRGRKAEQ